MTREKFERLLNAMSYSDYDVDKYNEVLEVFDDLTETIEYLEEVIEEYRHYQ